MKKINWKEFWRKIPHFHDWFNPHDGCCGKNFKKRECSKCGYEQWITTNGWQASPRERVRKLKFK